MRVWAAVPLMLAVFWTPSAAAASCTPTAASRNVPTALILSGGGAKGAYEAGSAAAFAERGLPFRIVAGSSAGALNAAMIVAGRADRLEALWRAVKKDQVYSLRAPVLFAGLLPGWLTLLALDGAGSLLDSQPLRGLITASVDFERIRSSPIRLLVTATDLARREQGLSDREGHTKELQDELKEAKQRELGELERLANMTVSEAKQHLLERSTDLVRHELARHVRQMEEEARSEAKA